MLFAFMLTSAFFAGNAYALAETTYVSATGVDNATCSLSAPCRLINEAMEVTIEEGIVIVLSTGEYPLVNITKSINIIGVKGVTAKIDGVNVLPETSGANILLRNLALRQTYNQAVFVGGAVANLAIEDCEFIHTNLASSRNGITIWYGGTYTLRNVKIRNFSFGIYATGGGGQVNLVIENSSIEACGTGVFVRGNVKALVSNTSSKNNITGFAVSFSSGTGSARLLLENVIATGNSGDGVYIYEGGAAYLNNSAISFNGYGVRAGSGSSAFSYGNNRISHNTFNTSGTFNEATFK